MVPIVWSWMRLLFSIFRLRTVGTLHFVEEAQSLDDAKGRVQKLAELWPGEYTVSNRATGERVSIIAGRKPD